MRIKKFQELMKELYFHHDSRRGVEATLNWLKTEINELSRAIKMKDKRNLMEEFADVFAWLSSLANLVGIDMERACMERYPNRCPKCGKNPCECEFRASPDK
ncbi:nucleotide pyrophosphohydrolase [Candidatus Geothermarchaeota archaeon]|nr:MAG: nucleotide pyrophosphohydrolase [Candidatus Geothermarchaeota archaeon]